jgi:hypothetical protein
MVESFSLVVPGRETRVFEDPVDGMLASRGAPFGARLVRDSDGAVLLVQSQRGLRGEALVRTLGIPPVSRVPEAIHSPPLHALGTLVLEPAPKGKPGRRKTGRRLWLPLDDQYLRERYPLDGAVVCAAALGRMVSGVINRAARLGVRCLSTWTPEHIELLRTAYPRLGAKEVARRTGHSPAAVRTQVKKLGLSVSRVWTEAESAELQRLWPSMTWAEIGERVGRSPNAVMLQGYKLGLKRGRSGARPMSRAA